MTLTILGIATSILLSGSTTQGEAPKPGVEEAVRLTMNPARDFGPTFGPDGRIAYISVRGTSMCICTMKSDGSEQKVIRQFNDFAIEGLSWGPNEEIVFRSLGLINGDNLFIIRSDGTGLRQLTNFQWVTAINAFWGRDNQIIFGLDPGYRKRENRGYYTITPDGFSMQKLPGSRAGSISDWPKGGPIYLSENEPGLLVHETIADGKGWRYESPPAGIRTMYAMESNGAGKRRLTVNPQSATSPIVCPDGRILFDQERRTSGSGISRTQRDIMIMDADGSNIKPITSDAFSDWVGGCNASGLIVFTSKRNRNTDIYTMKVSEEN